MNVFKRHLPIGLLAAMAAGIASVSASGVVTLHPATMALSVDLSSVTVTTITAQIYPSGGGQAISKSIAVSPPAPYTFDVTVDGGDPGNPADSGFSYRPSIYAYLLNPTASTSYLVIQKNNPVQVDNTPDEPEVSVPVAFNYPAMRRANATVTVIGGTISSFNFYASASNSPANEYYNGYSYGNGSSQTSLTSWVPMVAASNASVYGYVYVVDSNGAASQRFLASQAVDLSSGNEDVSWTVDLTSTGSLEGEVAISTVGSTSIPTNYQVVYQGASSGTSGIYGTIQVSVNASPTVPDYAADLTPGEYDVFLRTYFSNPSQYSETRRSRVTITAGGTRKQDFIESYGVAQVSLDIRGFYNISNIQSAISYLRSPNYSQYSYNYGWPVSSFDHTVQPGDWLPYYTYLRIYDQANPLLPINNTIYRYHYSDPDFPISSVTPTGVTNLGTESVILVKSNVYFDISEVEGAPQEQLSSPQIQAYKYDYNPDSSLRRQSVVYANGSSVSRSLHGLTMVAEPGTYVLDARANVISTNTMTRFNGSSITFGAPVSTPTGGPPGPPVEVVLTPVQNPALQVTLSFDQVDAAGISTVVETPLGPAPPEGFSIACGAGQTCDPVYYDISTTAGHSGETTVCIRRQFTGVSAAVGATFQLHHYNELLGSWDNPLPPPNGGVSSFNCSENPVNCGCADAASCGIDLTAVPVRNVFLVCGVTNSFSPFAIFERNIRFTNKVNGVEYTGPTGPPGLQQWVVPTDGPYRITATGAQGGSATNAVGRKGGCGVEVSDEFVLKAGDVIEILVGQKGTSTAESGGGGGGTFVRWFASPVVVAGGGGGVRAGALVDGRSGSVTYHGTAGSYSNDYTSNFIAGGEWGEGGARQAGYGAGGGGWNRNGAADGAYGEGGFSFAGVKNSQGGFATSCGPLAHGGYGGGGAGNGCNGGGGGGGGGYSGGGGGAVAGGGGSMSNGPNPTLQANKCTTSGHGVVTITPL